MTPLRPFTVPALILLLAALLVGCASPQRQFMRAEGLEKSGKQSQALVIYQKLLDGAPRTAPRTRSEIYYRMGECLYRMDRIAEAYSAYQKAVEVEPSNMAAHLRMGEFLLAAGAMNRARQEAELVMKKSGAGNPEALALWGAALADSGQYALAEDAYRRVLAVQPRHMQVAVALADIYNQENKIEEARKVLRESAEANPQSALPWLALGRLNEQEGEIAAAEVCYRKAVAVEDAPQSNLRLAQFLQRTSRINEAEQVLRKVDALRPSQPTALPDFELIAGKPGTALTKYQAALTAAPAKTPKDKLPSLMPGEQVHNRALLATRLVEADVQIADEQSGRQKTETLQRARGHLDVYRLDLDPATLAILEAEIALSESDLPRAAVQAKTAVSLAPQSAPAHFVLGMSEHRAGKDATARSEWLAALDADSHFVPARLALAEQALAAKDSRAAERYVTAVVRDEPGNVRALNLFARVLTAENRLDAASIIAHRAMAMDSSAAQPHVVLGDIALRQGRTGDALINFEQAILLQPHSPDAMEGLMRVYRKGTFTRAMLARMEKIATAKPPSAALLEIAGRLYATHGWYADAERCLKSAIRFDPQRTTAAAALAKIYASTGRLDEAADSASHIGGDSAALLAAVRAQERNDVPSAIENYERAIREGEHSGVAANNLAWLYVEQGTNLDRALQLAESARAQAPENPAVLDTVGVVRLRLHKYSEAISALESARNLAGELPSNPELLAQIRRHLSEAYLRAGKPEAAAAVENP